MYRKSIKYILAYLIIIFIAEKTAICQEKPYTASDTVSRDTIKVTSIGSSMDTLPVTDTVSLLIKHSPSKAAFFSAVLPGLGQIYNGKGLWWRLPILYAGIATEVYLISYFGHQYQVNHTAYVGYTNYVNSLNNRNNLYDPVIVDRIIKDINFPIRTNDSREISYIQGNLKNWNDTYKQWRDLNIILMAGVYFLNVVDATVQAYFFNYDISDNLTLKIHPTMINNSISNIGTFGMKMTFNLH